MAKKIIGVLKITIGILLLIASLIVTPEFFNKNSDNPLYLLGGIAGLIFSILYFIYIIHSGWTQFRNKDFKLSLFVFGIIVSIVIALNFISSLFTTDYSAKDIVLLIFVIMMVLFIVNDISRIRSKKNNA